MSSHFDEQVGGFDEGIRVAGIFTELFEEELMRPCELSAPPAGAGQMGVGVGVMRVESQCLEPAPCRAFEVTACGEAVRQMVIADGAFIADLPRHVEHGFSLIVIADAGIRQHAMAIGSLALGVELFESGERFNRLLTA